MSTKVKVIAVTLVLAVVGFMLNPNSPSGAAVWGAPAEADADPTGPQIGLLMFIVVVESLAFGLGVAFLAFGYPLVKRAGVSTGVALPAFLAIAWSLVSWVPHTAMHMTNAPGNYGRLILIEYLFHLTLVVGALLVARYFLAATSVRAGTTFTAVKGASVGMVQK